MRSALKSVFVLLVLVAVGAGQVMGVAAGFFCPCSGQISMQPDCEGAECHTEYVNCHDGESAPGQSVALDGDHGGGDSLPSPCRDQGHQQVRASFLTTPGVPCVLLPPMVWTECPTPVNAPWDDIRPGAAPWFAVAVLVREGGVSAALMVARTVVRRV